MKNKLKLAVAVVVVVVSMVVYKQMFDKHTAKKEFEKELRRERDEE